jgi:hypothetical protein
MANQNAKIDANNRKAALGQDETTGETRALKTDADGNLLVTISGSGGGSGDVNGPASSTDNAIARFDGTGGKTLQNSSVTIDDSDNVDGVTSLDIDGTSGNVLTADTDTLVVDATNDRVGVNTSSPSHALQVVGDAILAERTGGGASLIAHRTDGQATSLLAGLNGTAFLVENGAPFSILHATEADILAGIGTGTTRFEIDSSGTATFSGNIEFDSDQGTDIGTALVGAGDVHIGGVSGLVFNNDITLSRITGATPHMLFSDGTSYRFDADTMPQADDGAALGESGRAWSDLFLASGSVVNFDAGDVTITHSANKLDIDGGVADFGSTPTVNGEDVLYNQASLTAVTVATDDKVVIQDTSDSNSFKTVTTQAIADLASAGGTLEAAADAHFEALNFGSFVDVSTDNSSMSSATTGGGAYQQTAATVRLGLIGVTDAGATLEGTAVQTPDLGTLNWDADFVMEGTFILKKAATQDIFWGMGTGVVGGGTVSANATATTRHAGFFIEDGTIYASNADNTTQTTTDVSSGITLTDMNCWKIAYTGGTNIVFSINGSVVATHTTNMPSGSSSGHGFAFGCTNRGSGEAAMYMARQIFFAMKP